MARLCPWLLLLVALTCGCATSLRDRAWFDRQLKSRVGAATRAAATAEMPDGVELDDGLDEGEVVAIALWRNPALRAALTGIDSAQAGLDEAGRPANPQLTLMAPFGPITAVATVVAPLESLWQMSRRTEAAAREMDAAAEAALMGALDLVRDVRLLHAELGLAEDRLLVRGELVRVAEQVSKIASVRARLGEIGPLEDRLLRADALAAAAARDLAQADLDVQRARLGAQLALEPSPLRATFAADDLALPALGALVEVARASRPDARGAAFAIDAAAARAGWERSRAVALSAVVERHWGQSQALRLGARAELPIFGVNPGGVGRAEAAVASAIAQHEVIARTVVFEVSSARARALSAGRARAEFQADILPALGEALAAATRTFEAGDETFLVVLDVLRRVGDARLRHAELVAEQRSARAELERAIGARLVAVRSATATHILEGETR